MPPRTALHLSVGAELRDPRDDGFLLRNVHALGALDDVHAVHAALGGLDLYDGAHPERRIFDVAIAPHFFTHECVLERRLGRGSFGTAYLCRQLSPPHNTFVVKLPNEVLKSVPPPLPQPIDKLCLDPSNPGYAVLLENGRKELCRECYHAEHLLDAPYLRALRIRQYVREILDITDDVAVQHYIETQLLPDAGAYAQAHAEMVGRPLEGVTEVQYYRAVAEQATRRTHPGFYHIHRVLHMDASIPAIISHGHDGSLESLRGSHDPHVREGLTFRPRASDGVWELPYIWTQLATQLASAIDFIQTHTRIAHIDFKPGNVLYSRLPGTDPDVHVITCAVSDFGLLAPSDACIPAFATRVEADNYTLTGTPTYVPSTQQAFPAWFTGTVPAQRLGEFQFLTALLDMLRFADSAQGPGAYVHSRHSQEAGIIASTLQLFLRRGGHPVQPAHEFIEAHYAIDEPPLACVHHLLAGITSRDPAATRAHFKLCTRQLPLALNVPAPYTHFVAEGIGNECAREHAQAGHAQALERDAYARETLGAYPPPPDVSPEELEGAARAPEGIFLVY